MKITNECFFFLVLFWLLVVVVTMVMSEEGGMEGCSLGRIMDRGWGGGGQCCLRIRYPSDASNDSAGSNKTTLHNK